MAKMKVMVVGHARHGKDTVGELLKDLYGMRFQSSSMFCCTRFVFGALAEKYRYATATECYEDRTNHRKEWYDLIAAYNSPDKSRLGRELLNYNDVYCGVRSRAEFHAMKNRGLFTVSIFVDALDRLKPEPKNSMQIEPWMCDYVLDNNGTQDDLKRELEALMRQITPRYLQEDWR